MAGGKVPAVASQSPIVGFITDFGMSDNFVGVMKGVILSEAPLTRFIDITHAIPPQNVRMGAFQLMTSFEYFSKGTLFICVIDPGVGSKRKIIYGEAGGFRFIAPDNGLLSWVFERVKPEVVLDISHVKLEKPVSQTFHGRDIMAPVAAKVLTGVKPEKLGEAFKDWVKIPFPSVKKGGSHWVGEVLAIDNFGNLITNINAAEAAELAENSKVWLHWGDQTKTIRGLSSAYSQVEVGQLLAIGGSSGFIEISVRNGDAAQTTKINVGDPITLDFKI